MQDHVAVLNLLGGTLFLLWMTVQFVDFRARDASHTPYFDSSIAYDWGAFGVAPQHSYRSFKQRSPKPNLVRQNEHYDTGFVFLYRPGNYCGEAPFMIFDNNANLVWMPAKHQWDGVTGSDITVQQFKGRDYIVYRQLDSISQHNSSQSYIMVDGSYQVCTEIRPVGYFKGELRGIRISKNGGAIINFTNQTRIGADDTSPLMEGIYESIFQEVDLESGELLFEWRAASYTASINSVDKSTEGDYLVAGSFSGSNTVICVSHKHGHILWQLGGSANDFKDASSGAATRFSGYHQASFLQNETSLVILDHGSATVTESTGRGSDVRILELELDLERMVVSLAGTNQPLSKLSTASAVQFLPNGNILLSYDGIPSFREVSKSDVLCDVHFSPSLVPSLTKGPGMAGLAKGHNYRISKFHWVGQPKGLPEIAVDTEERAVYVSWNGATTIDAWVLQSKRKGDSDTWIDHVRVPKLQFETRIPIPRHSEEILRVVALDQDWKIAAYSRTASKHIRTTTLESHTDRRQLYWIMTGMSVIVLGVYMFAREDEDGEHEADINDDVENGPATDQGGASKDDATLKILPSVTQLPWAIESRYPDLPMAAWVVESSGTPGDANLAKLHEADMLLDNDVMKKNSW
ncbi:phosphatidylserine decarboxylase family protein [Purpureocillium lavendulum]|uniref:Phosphatidylserine decarboxylase family protein n=1 Tax=Purpureocillium lavendulum TaxID=1247861 RepID=A0AB34FKE7_9HYPO|nr:phosphatidylserine decarboxylase family protein [Purpureocillium lavendulum]